MCFASESVDSHIALFIDKLIAAFDVVNERNVKVQSLLNELKTKDEATEDSQNSSEETETRKPPNEIAELINTELLERTQQLTDELSRAQKLNDKLHRENRDLKLEVFLSLANSINKCFNRRSATSKSSAS